METTNRCEHPSDAIRRCIGGYMCAKCRKRISTNQAIDSLRMRIVGLEERMEKLEVYLHNYHGAAPCAICGRFIPFKNGPEGIIFSPEQILVCRHCLPEFWQNEVQWPMHLKDDEKYFDRYRKAVATWLIMKGRCWLDVALNPYPPNWKDTWHYEIISLAQSVGFDKDPDNFRDPWKSICMALP